MCDYTQAGLGPVHYHNRDVSGSERFSEWLTRCSAAGDSARTYLDRSEPQDFVADYRALRSADASVKVGYISPSRRVLAPTGPTKMRVLACCAGRCHINLRGSWMPMSAGFLAFASGAEPYSLVSSTPTVGTTLSVDRECLSVPRNSVDQLTVVYRPQLARFLHGVAQGLVSLEQHDSVGLTHHLAGLGDHVVRTVVNVAPNETTTARIRVEQIHRYISEHLADPNLSAAVIAQALHVSTRQVYQAFSTQPETLGQLIRRLRVAYAQSLAKAATPAANLDRAMLARQCGFGSVRSLQRALREHHHQL